jgi:hypothetical protein
MSKRSRNHQEVWESVEAAGETSFSKIVQRKTERGRKTWVIQSLVLPRVHVRVTVWEQDGEVGACAVPVVALDDVEVLLPTPFTAFGSPSVIAEWMVETAISGAIERADSYIQAASGIPAALVRGGHSGDVEQLGFMERDGIVGWPFSARCVIDDSTTVVSTFVLWAEESAFALKTQTHLLDLSGIPIKVLHEGEVMRTVTPSRIHSALTSSVPSIRARYPLPGTVRWQETPFQRLLRDPRAFGDNVVALDFRKKADLDHQTGES